MNAVKNILLGIFHGLWDSIRGMTLLLHIDAEIHRLNAQKEAERQRRLESRQARVQRSPSPTPSSASAMAREELRELQRAAAERNNSDERSLESILKKPTPPQEEKPKGEKKIAKQVLKCCLLNGGFTWLSIVLFDQLLLPTLKYVLTFFYGEKSPDLQLVWGWLQPILSIIFGMMWLLPIFVLSKIVSSLWFADIANAAYRVRKGRPQMIPNISKLVADFLFSLVVQALFLVQSMLVNLLPIRYVGGLLCFLHLCLLYSLYSFEYKWFNMGWELHRRLSYIENNWPYFLGFGIPLTVLTNMTSSVIVSSCIFSIFFPLFILSGNEAKPIVGTTDIPLRLFSPVIFTSNLFFNRTPKLTAAQIAQHKQLILQQKQQQEILMKQQVQEYYLKRQRSLQRERESQQPLQQRQTTHSAHSSPFRYKQPPQPAHMPRSTSPDDILEARFSPARGTSERGHYLGGLAPPLIPTPVPGAPTSSSSNATTSHRRYR